MKRRLLFLLLVGMLLPPIVPAVLDNTQPESSQQAACRGILLFGGTGRLGASIARLLVSAGEPVATGAQFLLDSESRLRATSSPGAGHVH